MRTLQKVCFDTETPNAVVSTGPVPGVMTETMDASCFSHVEGKASPETLAAAETYCSRKSLALFTFALLFLAMVTPGCQKDQLPKKPIGAGDQNQALGKVTAKSVQPDRPTQLVTGLAGSLGSTVGPGGDLLVPDPVAGSILRINPKTGNYMTFASGLPQMIAAVGLGGITDVAFMGGKVYALVTVVDDPALFPTDQINGIYRIDGPSSFTVIADIGAFNLAHPPTGFEFDVSTGVLYSMQPYRGGFLVTDGHLNRVLRISLDGDITLVHQFNDIVPTGLAVKGNSIFLSQAGPVPHLPQDGKVVSFSLRSPAVTSLASGAPLLVDVEFGRGQTLFALSQGQGSGDPAGSPAVPNTGSFVRVNTNGTFSVIADALDRPTSVEIIGNTAYIVTLTGDIWSIANIAGPPYGKAHQKTLLHRGR